MCPSPTHTALVHRAAAGSSQLSRDLPLPGSTGKDLAAAEHTGVTQPGGDSHPGAGDPPEIEDWTLPETPRWGLPAPSYSPPWAQPILGQRLTVCVLSAPDPLSL